MKINNDYIMQWLLLDVPTFFDVLVFSILLLKYTDPGTKKFPDSVSITSSRGYWIINKSLSILDKKHGAAAPTWKRVRNWGVIFGRMKTVGTQCSVCLKSNFRNPCLNLFVWWAEVRFDQIYKIYFEKYGRSLVLNEFQ